MEGTSKPPLLFANQAIRRLVDNQFGDEAMVLPNDYMTMRVVFRRCQGSWEQLTCGSVIHTKLLSKIIAAWGRLHGKTRKIEVR